MYWPITISQCKVMVDIISTIWYHQHMLEELGWKNPNTGPWARWGYYWRWGYSRDIFIQPSSLNWNE